MSLNQLLAADLTEDRIEISIGRQALLAALQMNPNWPTHQSGRMLRVVDEEDFLETLCNYLTTEDHDGYTPLHRAFDEAAETMFDDGVDSVENEHSIGADDFASDDEPDDDSFTGELSWGRGGDDEY